MKISRSQGGFHLWIVALVGVVFGVLTFVTLQVVNKPKTTTENKSITSSNSPTATPDSKDTSQFAKTEGVVWSSNGQEWAATGTVPACPNPVTLASPVNLADVEYILYPGQTRGGNYKPHGGFLMKGTDTHVTVKAPMDATVVHGSRYIEAGEVQQLLFFINDCGIAYRFDHLLTLSPAMQALADTLPQPKQDDSRTTNFDSPVKVKKGDVIATEVGFKKTGNNGFDWGVYDLRSKNEASKNAAFASKYGQFSAQTFYAVCWLDWLSPQESAIVKALPAGDMAMGKKSDYCK